MRELKAVSVKLSRGSFTLRADNTAFADIEDIYNKPFDEVVGTMLPTMKIREVCKVAAVFAQTEHPGLTGAEILKAAPLIEDLKALREGVMSALFEALPNKKEPDGEGSGEQVDTRPFENA